jgi:hypothetical protein
MDGGGLYGDASNAPPSFHYDAGLAAAAQVPDSGAVLVSLGMSITKAAFEGWIQSNPSTDAVLVNTACGGCVVGSWTSLSGEGWVHSMQELARSGMDQSDVDVVWMSVTEEQTKAARAADLEAILVLIRQEYPNVKQVFVSNRTYGGYRVNGSAEPEAWKDGLAVREFVLNHLGETAPWVGWGADLWANGSTPRSDGLEWLREDFGPDGLHYSDAGRSKVAGLAERPFESSPFTRWYGP